MDDDTAKVCNALMKLMKHSQNTNLSRIFWFESSHSASKLKGREREKQEILRNFCRNLLELHFWKMINTPSFIPILNNEPWAKLAS